jgi:hypothetical protein
MNKITKTISLTTILVASHSHAASIRFDDVNIKLEGGVSASAMYFENPGFLKRHDSYILNDALLEIMPEERKEKHLQFYAGIGILQKQTIDRIFAPLPPVDVELQYGWLEVPVFGSLNIEIGQLVTLLGYESSVSYKNQHALMGAVYSAQPSFYPGVRFKGSLGTSNYYLEVTNDSTIGDASAAAGIYEISDTHKFSLSYYQAIDARKMIDVVYAMRFSSILLGVNLDHSMLDDPAPNQDNSGTAVAVYANYFARKWEWPVRLEYINDGNTGVYNYDKGYTFTFSPTYRFQENQFIRAEVVTAKADGKPFRNDDGGFEEGQFIATLQVGIVF